MTSVLLAATLLIADLACTGGKKEEAVAEALIRQRVEDLTKALQAKDIDRAMSFYAPNVVSFDINPPLRYVGADLKRRAWQEGPGCYESHTLRSTLILGKKWSQA